MDHLRVAVIGLGKIAKIGHCPWYFLNPHVELVAGADPDLSRREEATRIWQSRKYKQLRFQVFADPMELFENAEKLGIHAVSICSPHRFHVPQVEAAFARGLHVLCEKPIAIPSNGELDQVNRLEQIVRKGIGEGLVFQTATQKRFMHAFQAIKEQIDTGRIGNVFQMSAYWFHYIPDISQGRIHDLIRLLQKFGVDPVAAFGGWRLDASAGGGDLLDHLPHYADLFAWWAGATPVGEKPIPGIIDISCAMLQTLPGRAHEDHGVVTLRLRENAIGLVERSQNVIGHPYGQETGHVHGTRGSLYWDAPHEYLLKPVQLREYAVFPDGIRTLVAPGGPDLHNPPTPDKQTAGGRRVPFSKSLLHTSYRRQCDAFVARVHLAQQKTWPAQEQEFHQIDPTQAKAFKDLAGSARDFNPAWIPAYGDGRLALDAVLAAYESNKKGCRIPLSSPWES